MAPTAEDAGNSGEAHAMTALPAICVASGQAVLAQGNDSGDPTLPASSLELHGFRAFDSGRVDDVRAALASLPNHALALNPSALALKAMVASLDGRFDLADVWFEMALRDARGAAREEIVVRYGLDLVRRGRSDVVTFLAGEVGRPGLDDSNATQLCALLATASVGVHRMSDARRAARKALRSLHAVSDYAVRARIFHQAAFVALNDGDMTSAGDLARFALEHAERAELYDVAARALSVLHNLSVGVQDDPAAARAYLVRMTGCARKATNPGLTLYAIMNLYELEVDAGNLAGIERLDGELAELRIFLTPMASESLLPARALRAVERQLGRPVFAAGRARAARRRRVRRDRALHRSALAADVAAGACITAERAGKIDHPARRRRRDE